MRETPGNVFVEEDWKRLSWPESKTNEAFWQPGAPNWSRRIPVLVSVFFVVSPREIQAGSTDKVTEVSTLQVPIRLAKDLRGTAQQQKKVNCEDKWIRVLLIRYRRNGGPGK